MPCRWKKRRKEPMFLCEICADSKPKRESFSIKGCSHCYCSECMQIYFASKLQDGVSQVNCPVPKCKGVLKPEYFRNILPFEVFERWGNLLCESAILASQKFYCPFKDCSALLIDDGGETVTQAECPSCFRLFCAQCKIGWHDGIECSEFQKLNKYERQKEDIMLRNLAKTKKWQRCPACKYYVEKSQGCHYMRCRCGTAFCYNCGAINISHLNHYCKTAEPLTQTIPRHGSTGPIVFAINTDHANRRTAEQLTQSIPQHGWTAAIVFAIIAILLLGTSALFYCY